MCIRLDKIDRFIRIYDGTTYLTLFGSEKYDAIYNRIRYFLSLKSGITYIFSLYFAKFKWFFAYRKILNLHVIILIRSVLKKDKNHYYYKVFLEKFSYQFNKKQPQIF